MAIYTVHLPPGLSAERQADAARFIRDGFSFWALVLPPVWLAWHRMWLALVGWIVVAAAIEGAGYLAGRTPAAIVGLAFTVWFALVARDIRRWTLARNGWTLAAVIEAGDRDAAECRFFEGWRTNDTRPARTASAHRAAAPLPAQPIGLFPAPGGRQT